MNPPPSLPPAFSSHPGGAPPVKPKSNTTCIVLGCAGLFLLGLVMVGAAGVWFYFAKGPTGVAGNNQGYTHDSGGGGSSGGADLGFGAKLSQYELAGGSACVVTADGTWHAIFQETSAYGKPTFIYHCVSRDSGTTWTAPENLSTDGTGNGAGFPKMAKDAQGNVYAAWIRFGGDGRAVTDVTLDGPGGYEDGTLTLRRWSGGQWGALMTLGTAQKVHSFCMYNAADGSVQFLWVDEGGMVARAPAAGGAGTVVAAAGSIPGAAGYKFGRNLSAVPDAQGGVIFTAERSLDSAQQLFIWAGGQEHDIAADPKYETRNTFNHPATLFTDRTGRLHVIYIPNPKLTEHNELWDIDPNAGTHQVIYSGRGGDETIQSCQVTSENGVAHVVMEWSAKAAIVADCTELVALSFDGANWSTARGLTGNSRAEKFSYKDLPHSGDVSISTRYHAKHASLAVDAQGNVHLLGTIQALSTFNTSNLERLGGTNYKVNYGGSVGHPSVYVIKWR